MQAQPSNRRYAAVAIVLHWAIAIGILGMIPLGWWMSDALEDSATRAQAVAAFQLHKSIGLTILVLSLGRLAWRLMNPPPPLPSGMAPWERFAAQAVHIGFYVLMIALPLTGWVYVSTGFDTEGRALMVPTLWFGLFEVPHLPIAEAAESVRRGAAEASMNVHSKLAWGAIVLAALHVGAALKHQFVNRDGVLARMVPGLASPEDLPEGSPARRIGLIVGLAAVALAALGLTLAVLTPPARSVATTDSAALEASAPTAPEPAPPVSAPALPSSTEGSEASVQPTTGAPAESNAAEAAPWQVDRARSSIAFGGDHAGTPIVGRFTDWDADIRFSPQALADSRVRVRIRTASASTENPLHQSTLREAEWFDVAHFPTAEFEARTFRRVRGNRYEATGTLRLKDKDIPITLPFELRINGNTGAMTATLTIDRVAAGLGLVSDANADWVSRQIPVTITVQATTTP
jgi:cytochrome b561